MPVRTKPSPAVSAQAQILALNIFTLMYRIYWQLQICWPNIQIYGSGNLSENFLFFHKFFPLSARYNISKCLFKIFIEPPAKRFL